MSAIPPPKCDCPIAETAPACPSGVARPRMVLATTILASSLAFIDGSVVNVGLPAIGRDLGADGTGVSWIVNGYLLPLSALLLLGGAAGDRYGRRRLLMLGVGLFALASLLCGLAPSLGWLVAGRVLQGMGAAMLMPNSLAILGASFSGAARGRAIGIWASVGAAAGAVAPLIGGWMIDATGWRTIFMINLPIAAAAWYLGRHCLKDERDPVRPVLDLAGAVLASAGLGSLTWGLTQASGANGMHGDAALASGVGVLVLLYFLTVERRAGEQAMLPLALFGSRRFTGLNLLTFLLYGALSALLVLVPFVLIEVHGYSAIAAGAALLPLPVVIAIGSPLMGRIAGNAGARLPLTLGPAIAAAGCLLATRIGGDGSYWSVTLPAMLLLALGMAIAVAPLTTAVLAAVGPQYTGVASGVNSAVARIGGLMATAMLGMVLSAHGPALVAAFHWAALAAALAAFAAGASGFIWLAGESEARPQ